VAQCEASRHRSPFLATALNRRRRAQAPGITPPCARRTHASITNGQEVTTSALIEAGDPFPPAWRGLNKDAQNGCGRHRDSQQIWKWDARSSVDGARVFHARRLLRCASRLDPQVGSALAWMAFGRFAIQTHAIGMWILSTDIIVRVPTARRQHRAFRSHHLLRKDRLLRKDAGHSM
jgi:hypothetical protein